MPATKTAMAYTASAPTPHEATWEDQECCLITLRCALTKMRQTAIVTRAIAVIDSTRNGPGPESKPCPYCGK